MKVGVALFSQGVVLVQKLMLAFDSVSWKTPILTPHKPFQNPGYSPGRLNFVQVATPLAIIMTNHAGFVGRTAIVG